ncbi:MAG: hypothetical protein AVDCRST_MAG49-2526, partial [uncultured Thermomicrobiales bacterium]
ARRTTAGRHRSRSQGLPRRGCVPGAVHRADRPGQCLREM